jgi:transposase
VVRQALAPVTDRLRRLGRLVRDLGRRLRAERLARKKAEAERDRLRRAERVAHGKAHQAATERDRLRREIASLRRQLRAERTARKKATAAAERARRRGDIAALQREIDRLKGLLEEARREAKRQASPFRRRKRVENPKPPGRKKGHAPAHRPVPDHIDEEAYVPLGACPDCAGAVEDVRDLEPIIVIDVGAPPAPGGAHVRRLHCQSGYCPRCRRRVQSRHPEQPSTVRGATAVHIGPRMQGLAADLHSRVGVTWRKITGIFQLFFGVTFSPGAWARAARRIRKRLEPTYLSLVAATRETQVTYLDETGWHVAMVRGKKAWLHVLSAPALGITLFAIRFSRGREVAEEILGDYQGISVLDGWAAYLNLPWRKGQCHAHLLRRCAELLDVQTRGAARFPLAVERLLLTGLEVKRLLPGVPAPDRAALADQMRGEMRQLLQGCIEEPANRRFANHLRRHEEELFTYLDVDAVEPTNNEGERETRPGVVVRKIQGGNRTPEGAHDHEVIATVSRTAERNGLLLPNLLPALICSTKPEVILPVLKDRPMPAPVPPLPGWKALTEEPIYQGGDHEGGRRGVRRAGRRVDRGAGRQARPPPPG